MNKIETLEEFYKRKFDWMPDNIRNEIGHFNIFRLEPFVGDKAPPVPYKRRDYYKIMLVVGNSKVHYADKVVEVTGVAQRTKTERPKGFQNIGQVNEATRCAAENQWQKVKKGSAGFSSFPACKTV